MPTGQYAREPRHSYVRRAIVPILYDVRLTPEIALLVDKAARRRGVDSVALLQRVVAHVFVDDLVKAVLDE